MCIIPRLYYTILYYTKDSLSPAQLAAFDRVSRQVSGVFTSWEQNCRHSTFWSGDHYWIRI